ncbi:hypothetical protein ACMFMG_009912 [Clarireedia jacksonii]
MSVMDEPAGGDVDRGRTATIIVMVQISIAILIVAARFYARYMIKNLGKDDWCMLFTLILFICYGSLMAKQWSLGGFRHLHYLTMEESLRVAKLNYILQVIIVFSYITGKAAVGFLVLRVIGRDSFVWRKWAVYTVIGATAIINGLDCIFTYVQCSPPRALWDPSIPHKCWDPSVQSRFAIFTASENCAADVVLAIVPATVIYGLNMEMKKRINLCILLGLGLIAAICCIVKTTYVGSLNAHSDLTWKTYDLLVWSGSELFVIIVCGSIPPLKPFWDKYVTGKSPTYGSSGAGYSNNSHLSSFRRKSRATYIKQNYDNTTASSTDQVNSPPSHHPNIHGDKWIQATTDIEIQSVRIRREDEIRPSPGDNFV